MLFPRVLFIQVWSAISFRTMITVKDVKPFTLIYLLVERNIKNK